MNSTGINRSSRSHRGLLSTKCPVYAVSTCDHIGTYHYSTQPMLNIDNGGTTYVIPRDIAFMRDIDIDCPVRVYLTHHTNAQTFINDPNVNRHVCEFEFSITNEEIEKLSSNVHVQLSKTVVVDHMAYTLEMTLSQYEEQNHSNKPIKMVYSIALPALTISNY